MVHEEGIAALPAFPTEIVHDPTGAGDSFAGGMMGHVARIHEAEHFGGEGVTFETLQEGLMHGTVIASFTIESFSLERLATLTTDEIDERTKQFARVVRTCPEKSPT